MISQKNLSCLVFFFSFFLCTTALATFHSEIHTKERLDDDLKEVSSLFQKSIKDLDSFGKVAPVIIYGRTGNGKSTFCSYALGVPLENKSELDTEFEFEPISSFKGEYADTGHEGAKTSHPALYMSKEDNLWYCDTPGLGDTRSTNRDIATGLAINTLIRRSKGIQALVFVISYPTFEVDRGARFADIMDTISRIFNYDNKKELLAQWMKNVFFIFTKFPTKWTEKSIQDKLEKKVKKQLEVQISLSETSKEKKALYRRAKEGVETILEHAQENVFLLFPEEILSPSQLREKIIKKIKSVPYIDKKQIGYVIDSNIRDKIASFILNASKSCIKIDQDYKNALLEQKKCSSDMEHWSKSKKEYSKFLYHVESDQLDNSAILDKEKELLEVQRMAIELSLMDLKSKLKGSNDKEKICRDRLVGFDSSERVLYGKKSTRVLSTRFGEDEDTVSFYIEEGPIIDYDISSKGESELKEINKKNLKDGQIRATFRVFASKSLGVISLGIAPLVREVIGYGILKVYTEKRVRYAQDIINIQERMDQEKTNQVSLQKKIQEETLSHKTITKLLEKMQKEKEALKEEATLQIKQQLLHIDIQKKKAEEASKKNHKEVEKVEKEVGKSAFKEHLTFVYHIHPIVSAFVGESSIIEQALALYGEYIKKEHTNRCFIKEEDDMENNTNEMITPGQTDNDVNNKTTTLGYTEEENTNDITPGEEHDGWYCEVCKQFNDPNKKVCMSCYCTIGQTTQMDDDSIWIVDDEEESNNEQENKDNEAETPF